MHPSPATPKQWRHRACTVGIRTTNKRKTAVRVDLNDDVTSIFAPEWKSEQLEETTHVEMKEVGSWLKVSLVEMDTPGLSASHAMLGQKTLERLGHDPPAEKGHDEKGPSHNPDSRHSAGEERHLCGEGGTEAKSKSEDANDRALESRDVE